MSSRANDQGGEVPKRPRTEDAEVYRYGRPYRWLAYSAVGVTALSLCAVIWALFTTGGADVNWGAYAGLAGGLGGAAATAPVLLSELYLTEDRLRKEWSLRPNREVCLHDVRRVFIGGVSVELYVDSDHDPDLTFNRNVQDGDDLIEKLVGRLPASARVDHPSGELSERLGERWTAA
ncbi:hypothetical protein [Salinibacter grassmerensis]|uniref:hypothetical protein n=1 Tax=Salinibacter grassmerensis TaxID=3040353 RepID=UPI0021E90207|nr:hypothetical protein [Salinibacter grassmerensis]